MEFITKNKIFLCITGIYALSMISVIGYGTPNQSHPFPYHMDEWHQLLSIYNTYKHGTPNIPGSAHGSMLQFVLSGIYLIPFVLFKVIDPHVLSSSVSQLDMQERLFIILRINTLLFGIGSLFWIHQISKKHFSLPTTLPLLLFTVTPVWIALSNFFKYDIALVFWICASLFFSFQYAKNPTRKRFLISAFVSACGLSTKLSAFPLFLLLVISFFLFTKAAKQKLTTLVLGIGIFIITFLVIGVPDIFLPKAEYSEFFSSNLVTGPASESNYIFPLPVHLYLFFYVYPTLFGHVFYWLFISSIGYWIYFLFQKYQKKSLALYKKETFLLCGFILFTLSLIPLKIGATGNRMLVLLPFLSLLAGLWLTPYFKKRYLFFVLFVIGLMVQISSAAVFIYPKIQPSPQQQASVWLVQSIKTRSTIGLENIPIYQNIPDLALKEYYQKQNDSAAPTHFNYVVIDEKTPNLPSVVIVTNEQFHQAYLKKSPKKELLARLHAQGYKKVASFYPDKYLFALFGNDLNFIVSGVNPSIPIAIYQKRKES